jgi:diacylglycerol O-acyltransferase / wax synthase
MRRLSSLDAQFLAAERGNAGSHFCGLAVYDTGNETKITAEHMRELLRERIAELLPLRWKVTTVPLGLDHPVFVETAVDLDYHVSETSLDAPADDAALAAAIGEILSKPLDRSRPLWKLQVVHGLPGRTAVVTTLHHAAIDGIAAGEIFAAMHDVSGEATSSRLEHPQVHPEPTPSQAELALRGLVSLPPKSLRAIRSTPRAIAHLDQVPALRSLPGVHTVASAARGDLRAAPLDAPRTRFNTKLSGGRSVAFGTVSFREVKAAKQHLGVTVNDIVVALCAGALRRRLAATGDLPDEPLVAYIPVSVRLPDAKDPYGNAISSIIAGAPLLAHYPLSLVFDGFALNITVVSYQDGLDIGIVGDAEALPDAWELMDEIRSDLAELSELIERSSTR